MATTKEICDSCFSGMQDYMEELGFPDLSEDDSQVRFMCVEMGAEIADHICDSVEDPGKWCDCACAAQRRRRGE